MLQGHLEIVTRGRIAGWAWDDDHPNTPVSLVITADEQVIGRVLANRFRADLRAASIGNGRFSFELLPDPRLHPSRRHVVTALRESDGAVLHGSFAVLEASTAFDQDAQEGMAAVLAAVDTQDDLDRRLAFLARQMDVLQQIQADRRSGVQERDARRSRRLERGGRGEEDAFVRPRALVIDEQVPRPGRDAGSNAILSHMRSLQRLGFEVSFAAADLDDGGAALEAADIVCCARPWVTSIEEVLARQAGSFQLVYLHRGTIAARYAALVRHHQPRARLVYSVADLHFLRLARQAAVEQRPELDVRSRIVQTTEMMAAWYADAVVTHSRYEGALLAKRLPPARVHVVPWAIPVRRTRVPFAARRGLAFVGGYAHRPNVDAARWLALHVMPALDPAMPCLLVGSNMPDSLREVARGGIEAVGQVDDLGTVFGRVRLTVAPLAYGAGIKGKVLDSLAAGIPCVCTSAAAEGLDLPPLLLDQVADDPAGLAAKIRALHEDEALNAACSAAGLAYVEDFAAEDRIDALMRSVVGSAARSVE